MNSVPENICEDLVHHFPGAECLILCPEFPAAGVEGLQLQQHRARSSEADANTPVVFQSLANAFGRCVFVVDRPVPICRRWFLT